MCIFFVGGGTLAKAGHTFSAWQRGLESWLLGREGSSALGKRFSDDQKDLLPAVSSATTGSPLLGRGRKVSDDLLPDWSEARGVRKDGKRFPRCLSLLSLLICLQKSTLPAAPPKIELHVWCRGWHERKCKAHTKYFFFCFKNKIIHYPCRSGWIRVGGSLRCLFNVFLFFQDGFGKIGVSLWEISISE